MAKRKNITGIKRKKAQNSRRPPANASQSPAAETPINTLSAEGLLPARIPPLERLSGGHGEDGYTQYRVSKTFGRMKPRTKHVSQAIVRSKWTTLSESAQRKVESVLRSVQLPVLARYTSEQEKLEAQVALKSLIQTLSKRLPKMPFPPKTKEEHFDYETLVRSNCKLQQQLADSANSITSLTDELEKQRAGLQSENHDQKV